MFANYDVAQAYIDNIRVRGATSNSNHESKFKARKTPRHITGHGCGIVSPVLTSGQARHDDIMFANASQDIRIRIISCRVLCCFTPLIVVSVPLSSGLNALFWWAENILIS
ncbi:uncharacterized protein ColSpa_11987 [Colletotrichum spaethianum]|uniref:Uncharacterized protein n=1 Tax=Colletotrichum spaethianum TaxID=700344 RepID=A0AA37PGC7_9PEZI|nr:uncharacterized protein ColSpa_11987 [Colletotrichum spaethianum]GKT51806.1 hypothetical protein ColSpa_11987 [Colletotrichum spaethianum]